MTANELVAADWEDILETHERIEREVQELKLRIEARAALRKVDILQLRGEPFTAKRGT